MSVGDADRWAQIAWHAPLQRLIIRRFHRVLHRIVEVYWIRSDKFGMVPRLSPLTFQGSRNDRQSTV
ncbi:hypothetical protein M413DRAFT_81194 [Hebeloma cylindrosporum]|uniref:Uncharacterized protein n=1 Tax=Hebeloma cylindrosporum TaxID=76867 RepID=A0A0C3CWN0_HEBCY|nr:hypothetical protein M413DRAFT_81194 [Hebeloma cylindrosporum h7]